MELLRKIGRSGLRWYCTHGLRGCSRALAVLGPWLMPKGGVEELQVGQHRIQLDHRIRATRFMAYGCYERFECRHLPDWVPIGGVAIDCGANIGYMAAQMASAAGPCGRVYAFEPSPTCIEALQALVQSSKDSNITVVAAAVAEAGRQGLYYETEHILSHGFGRIDKHPSDRHRNVTQHAVRIVSLDDYFRDADLRRLDFVKVDVEGAEMQVFRGMKELFAAGFRPRILCEISVAEGLTQASEIPDLLGQYGYRAHRVSRRIVPLDTSALSSGFHGNVLFLPSASAD